ncbi:hypothetical protein AAVH_27841 [Aphelenchoides avenae]|nr:hypothetical protein AAVH_27841 [Aphelenchus avenae]
MEIPKMESALHVGSWVIQEEDGGDYIDSHLHLDLMDADGITVIEWKPKLDQRFRLAGCIANYCYPQVFMPTSSYAGSQNVDRRKSESMAKLAWINLDVLARKQTLMPSNLVLGACFGVHPKNASEYNDEVHERLRSIFSAGGVSGMKAVAVGECGLDKSSDIVPLRSVQEEAFRRQVELAKEFNLPLVLHLRGRGCHDDTLDRWAIEFLKPLLDKCHRIHRHCFCHSKETADAWIAAFPNTMFGLTPKIAGKRCEQHLVTFAREYPLDHIMLETDSPFFDRTGRGHPGNALTVAKELARLRGIRVKDVLKKTTANTKMLYGLPDDA